MKTNVQDMTEERTSKKWVWGRGVVDLTLLVAGDSNSHFTSKAGFLVAAAAFLVVDSNFDLSKQGDYSAIGFTQKVHGVQRSLERHKACETDRLTGSWW